MGDHAELGNHSVISAYHAVEIANGVLTGSHVYIADHNHRYNDPYQHIYLQGVECSDDSRVSIGEGTWIGTNAVIVGNISIGKQCVIGANSVVTHDIPDYSVAAGIPAKVIKTYDFSIGQWVKV